MDSHPCISILHSSMHDGVVENPKDEILGFLEVRIPFSILLLVLYGVWE